MNDQAKFDPKAEILAAADGLATLAMAYGMGGRDEDADRFYRLSADIELRSPELQACWGGPLNGQVGRRRIMDDLIARYRPTCIIETGTFRGLTTGWFAQRFDGPILTCEASKRYFYQAERNLAKHGQVSVILSDSRKFLADLDIAAPARARPLVYLDAHWEKDLPLREELKLLIDFFESFVAVIDDFRVPGDSGYSWDDYGGGDALTVDYLRVAGLEGCSLLFPTLRSDAETGARRGCCVVSRGVPRELEDGGLLRGGSLEDWLKVQAGDGAPGASLGAGPQPRHDSDAFDPKQASYPDQIVHLRQSLQVSQGDAVAKEAVIQDLRRTCDDRQRVIDEKEAIIQDLKRTCDDRQCVIDELVAALNAERSRP